MEKATDIRGDKGPGQNPLGTQGITSLLMKYAIPSVVSMLVMSIYNIVDQIFIGRDVGFLGNSATTVAFPLVTLGLAMSLLIGNGAAAFISLELGRGSGERVQRAVGNAVLALVALGVVFTAVVLVFLQPILRLLGATDEIMPYAVDYTGVIMAGMTFSMFGVALSHVIRADGSPRFSMVCTLVGALLNIALDPIFIFGLGMGVRGAAIATVLSQMVTFVVVLYYLMRRARHTILRAGNLRPHWGVIGRVAALGSASFFTQLAVTLLNVVVNNTLRHYGAQSVYGPEIPIAAMGIVLKINGILLSAILGFTIGAQPILGYNYGAKNYGRVRSTYKTVVTITFALSTVAWLLFLTVPQAIVAVFGDSSADFNAFAGTALRTFMGAALCAGIQIPSASYFQSVGKPVKAMTLSMTRQILFLMPLVLILPLFFGLEGVLYAGPVGDVLALLVTLVFITREMRGLGREIASQQAGAAQADNDKMPDRA